MQNSGKRRGWLALVVIGIILLPIIILITWFSIFKATNSREVRRLEAKVRSAGQPLTLDELAKSFPQVDDEENAALLLIEIWKEEQPELWTAFLNKESNLPERKPANIDPAVPFLGTTKVSRTAPVELQSLKASEAYLKANSMHMQKLRQALQRPKCRFPLQFQNSYNMLMPHLAEFKGEAQKLRLVSLVATERGDTKTALAALEDLKRLEQLLSEEPTLISQLVRVACANITLEEVERLVNRRKLTEPELQQLTCVLESLEMTNAVRSALIGERVFCMSVFYAPPALAKLPNSDTNSPDAQTVRNGLRMMSFLGLKAPDQRLMLETLEKAIDLAGKNTPDALSEYDRVMAEVATKAKEFPPKVFSAMLLPAMGKAATRFAKFEATRRSALTSVAVERYRLANQGRLPGSLEDLSPKFISGVFSDPFDGKPLRFTPQNQGYVIYSVGEDRIDNNGTPRPPSRSSGKQIDEVFSVERP